MKIWIVGDPIEKRELWAGLLTNSLPLAEVITCNYEEPLTMKNTTDNDIVFCLTGNFDESLQSVMDYSMQLGLPVLCVADNVNATTYEYLIGRGIKGLLDSERASLNAIKDAIRIIQTGGYYIESPTGNRVDSAKRLTIENTKPLLNIDEWKVFSLKSRGFSVEEISKLLNISGDEVKEYEERIVAKTNRKVPLNVVASGICRE